MFRTVKAGCVAVMEVIVSKRKMKEERKTTEAESSPSQV
jgi:hypothetical protein